MEHSTSHLGLSEDAAIVLALADTAVPFAVSPEDEAEVVEKAHRRPRFVEDCVREMIRMAVEEFADFGDETFVMARQENLETIHQHNVVAERHGLLEELRQEVETGVPAARHTSLEEWLATGAARHAAA